jgi:hypothetical protein
MHVMSKVMIVICVFCNLKHNLCEFLIWGKQNNDANQQRKTQLLTIIHFAIVLMPMSWLCNGGSLNHVTISHISLRLFSLGVVILVLKTYHHKSIATLRHFICVYSEWTKKKTTKHKFKY